MVDYGCSRQTRETHFAALLGLACEGNLDIFMSWGRTLTYWYLDISTWMPLGCHIGVLGGFIDDLGYQNVDILMSLACLNHG